MWVYDCDPLLDGEYTVIALNGKKMEMSYTREGGWNTFYTREGRLIGSDMSDFVVGWKNPLISEEKMKKYYKNTL